jgi:hypothetical protein
VPPILLSVLAAASSERQREDERLGRCNVDRHEPLAVQTNEPAVLTRDYADRGVNPTLFADLEPPSPWVDQVIKERVFADRSIWRHHYGVMPPPKCQMGRVGDGVPFGCPRRPELP